MEPPLQSRSSTDLPSPNVGPIPLFDAHLRVLSDSYISFFLERKRIEENYADALTKLHRKIKSVDTYLDDRTEMTTTRRAWNDIRDNTEREVQARLAFLPILSEEVIKPLTTLKETQERIRKRIKEDLKDSGMAYDEYLEITLPKLKSRYLKKFAEVDDQRKVLSSAPLVSPGLQGPDPTFTNVKPAAPSQGRPNVTSPQPLRALDRRPSGGPPHTARNRSPSSTTAFSDLAHQGKRQLNSLIGFLDKGGGTVKDSLGGRENQALKTVRAKRELDEADKDYRKGVHWLETLRLRRTKTLESGYKSLSSFVEESSTLLKVVLEKYTDNLTATTTTETQLFTHAHSFVGKIAPEKDVAKLTASIPRSLASAIPEPVLYQHGQVGECNDLIFGFSLLDYATARNLPEGDIPRIVKLCIAEIDKRGLDSEGIYRVSGRHANVQALQHEIERDEASFAFQTQRDDIYAVASLLKLYLRELPEPVFRYSLQDRIQHTEDFAEHRANNFRLLRSKIRRLPPVHQATLKALLKHLSRVYGCCEKNKMDTKNLAIVFGGVMFGEDEIPKGGDLLSVQTWKDSLMEDLIEHANILFQEQDGNDSPPLPPTPLGEPAPKYTYGSKTTKVANLIISDDPPPPPPPEDFTPKLPARPANSIHPSARANPPPSPTKERTDGVPTLPPRPPPSEPISSAPSTDISTIAEDETSETDSGSEDAEPLPATSPDLSVPLSRKPKEASS